MDHDECRLLRWLFWTLSSAAVSWPAVLAAVFLLCVAAWQLDVGGGRRKSQSQLPPGSMGLPLLGETLQFAVFSTGAIGTPLPFFSSRLQRYGTIFKTHLLGRPAVVSMDPELSKLLLSKEDKLVRAYLPKYFLKILGPTIHMHGASHLAFRELANLTVSSNAVQKLHLDSVQDHFLACLRSWQQRLSPFVIDAQQHCKEWAFTYSLKYFTGLEDGNPIAPTLMRDFFILPTGYTSIPINLPGTRFNKVLKARERIISTLVNLVRARIAEGRTEAKDFLDLLLKRADDEPAGRVVSREYYSGLHIAEWISSFVVAAYENTAVLFSNIIKFLSENEHVLHELRRENLAIQKSKQHEERLTWDDYRDMNFTKSVVKETLRMGSIAQHLLRISLEEIRYKGIVIPKGWLVVLNFSMVHLNSNYHVHPLRFDPWRWVDSESNNLDFLIPFGGGPRRCPGSTLTIFEASIFIHYLVTLYKWRRVQGKNKDEDEVDCLSQPIMRNGLFIKVEALDSNTY